MGYDYWRGGGRTTVGTAPNAVLEDVTGILLCYDELYFLGRDFCPQDMWELPYVHFLTDMQVWPRALIAVEQIEAVIEQRGSLGYGDIGGEFSRITKTLAGDARGIDNHTGQLVHTNGVGRRGNSAHADSALIDLAVADTLEMASLDVLTNTVASKVLEQKLPAVAPKNSRAVQVAQELSLIRFPNAWGANGGYDPVVEDMRHDDKIEAFRKYLAELPDDPRAAREVAAEVSRKASDLTNAFMSSRLAKRPLYKTAMKSSISPAGNVIHPYLGTLLSGLLTGRKAQRERDENERTRWAAFVIALRTPR